MQVRSFGKPLSRGASTLELLLALAILTLALTAVILVIFGNQSVVVDTETNIEALGKAGAFLERARAQARADFPSVVSMSSVSTSIIPYTQTLSVADLTACKKQATSTVSWASGGRVLSVDLTTYLSDIKGALALGGDCSANPPSSSWKTPQNFNSIDFAPSGVPATGIDVEHKIVFMTGDDTSAGKADFFVFDARSASLSTPPTQLYALDTGRGLLSVDAVEKGDGYYYAFVGNSDTTVSPLEEVLVIQEPQNLSSGPSVISTITLPNMTAGLCPGTQCPVGRTVYYYDNRLYVGTQYLANLAAPQSKNNEFHIYDVSNPASPTWLGSYNVDHNVNAIRVRGKYAYLATSGDTSELEILKVDDPSHISLVKSLDVGGSEDANDLDLLGSYVYLGKDRSSPVNNPDFFVIDVSDPTTPSVAGSVNVPTKPNTSIRTLRVVGTLAFIGSDDSTDPFRVYSVADPNNPVQWNTSVFNFSEKMTDLDYEDDMIYTANESNDALRIIYGP